MEELGEDPHAHLKRFIENDTVVALQAQLTTMTNILQTITLNQVNTGNGNQINVVNQMVVIGYVGCGEPHVYERSP